MPKIAKQLSASQVKELAKKVGEYSVGGEPGLILSVRSRSDGTLSVNWVLRRQGVNGFKIGLGAYPLMSLKAARDEAHAILLKAQAGDNPAEERRLKAHEYKERKLAAERENELSLTLEQTYREFFDWKEQRGDWKRAGDARRKAEQRFEKHVLPLGGQVVVSKAVPEDVVRILMPIWCEKATTADKLMPLLRSFFSWAVTVRKIRSSSLVNPASRDAIAPLLPAERLRKKRGHFPFLEPEQLPHFMAALHQDAERSVAAQCVEFAILTCSRSENARSMRWSQVDFETGIWTIDAEDMKVTANGQHVVPLSKQALQILQTRLDFREFYMGDLVFPSPRDGKVLSNSSLNMVIKRLHATEKIAGREGWIDREMTKKEGVERVAVQHAISRSTFETWAQSLRKDSRTIALCLHHDVDTKLRSAYDRDQSIEWKRTLLQEWADFAFQAA